MTPKELAEFALAMANEVFKPQFEELWREQFRMESEAKAARIEFANEMTDELHELRKRCIELEALNNDAARRAMSAGTSEDQP